MNRDTVVLIHGLGRTRASMLPIQIAAQRRGYRVINFGYPSRRGSVAEHAERLATRLQGLRDARRVHFITHSLGGIIVRAFLAKHPLPNIGRIVMLAPPNRGSEVADVLRAHDVLCTIAGKPVAELGTNDDSTPNSLPEPGCEVAVIAGNRTLNALFSKWIRGENDGKVSVERTKLDRLASFAVVPHTHTFMMCAPRVIRMAVRFVHSGAF